MNTSRSRWRGLGPHWKGNTMSKIDELKAAIERVFPLTSSPRFVAGCQKRTGSGGTRKLKPTLKLEGSISWCVRPVKRRPRGLSRTCEASHNGPILDLLCASSGSRPESGPTKLRPPERKSCTPFATLQKGWHAVVREGWASSQGAGSRGWGGFHLGLDRSS